MPFIKNLYNSAPACTRVVHYFGSLNRGGAESMIMNLYRNFEREKVQFDFVVNETLSPYAYEKEIEGLGGRIYYLPALSPGNLWVYGRKWRELLINHPEWKIIHIHHTSIAFLSIPIAKRLGRITIAHSHTAGSDQSLKSKLKIASRYPVRHLADHLFSCSVPASQWMFGNQSSRAHILNNAINTHTFLPDSNTRKHIRELMGFNSSHTIIGHVGRFIKVKNHAFMLEVLKVIVEKDSNVIMILIGDGSLKPNIMKQAEDMKLSGNIRFTGIRSDIADLMQGMDAFIFPSLYEGLPVTLIEAQASGLPCLVSDTVSKDVKLTECIEFMSLDTPVEVWATRLLEMATQKERRNTQTELSEAGYNVQDNTKWLQNFYLSQMEID